MLTVLASVAVPAPAPQVPNEVKVRPLTAVLFESPEMLQECRKARAKANGLRKAFTEAEMNRFEAEFKVRRAYKPATKPIDDLTPEELQAWNAQRLQLRVDLSRIEAEYHAAIARIPGTERDARDAEDTAERICLSAATSSLTKGTRLIILRAENEMLNVRVETGRSTGKVGWVLPEDVRSAGDESP